MNTLLGVGCKSAWNTTNGGDTVLVAIFHLSGRLARLQRLQGDTSSLVSRSKAQPLPCLGLFNKFNHFVLPISVN